MCPEDRFRDAGYTCGPATGACDIAETCSGRSADCPTDAVMARGTVCGPARGECDVAETCPGPGANGGKQCPPDAVTDGRTCHAGAGMCWSGTCCPGATRDAGNGCELANANVVFVTSRDVAGGGLGGLAGGDDLCNELAAAANLAGTFTAWLSTDPQGRTPVRAVDRLAGNTPFARVDGQVVAGSSAELQRTIGAPIELTEWNARRGVQVWTGTNTSGSGMVGATCGDWLNGAARGEVGRSSASDLSWTMFEPLACDAPFALYCFQD
jgi:hypothetical protein